ncbi:unnamed protein product [Ilex paraguariensis]|uniref:Cellulose synthase-like protein E6 n=1 Tax=Ilex paraguariensis TaxID=185542 RepID=A0ABC8UN47_9AQUA
MGKDGYLPLFETKSAKGRIPYWLYAGSMIVGIGFIFVYRVSHLPAQGEDGRWAWIGLFLADLWFSFYWFVTQSARWNPIYRYTFKERLSQRYEKVLPGIDIFVCTADPVLEPPLMVINTVLSVMTYSYPPEKMNVYLSDDGGSELMFYALLEASRISKYWLPFCKKFRIEPRSPAAYFSKVTEPPLDDHLMAKEWSSTKRLYSEMEKRINNAMKLGRIPDKLRREHKGFREWDVFSSKRDHHTILQMLVDGRDTNTVDNEGKPLPTLVYLAREKRPQYHHNFKAGALNALIRVSSRISNSPIILNVDCDMYSNNSESVRDAMCFFMDEERSHEIAFVQFPQSFDNLTKNDLYCNSLKVIMNVEFLGHDSNGGPLYIGTGCFHRRDVLCGKKYNKGSKIDWKKGNGTLVKESADVLQETCGVLASCTYEENTQWGKEMGVMYGIPVEDVVTGLSIQHRGWKSVYLNPERKAFLGLAPTTLLQTLVQHKRWSEGDFQIFCSKYCPFLYGYRRIPLGLQISYCCYLLWAPNCLATLFYVAVPPLCLLRGVSLFPELSSPWVLPFGYVIIAKYAYSLGEFMWCRGTLQGWLNDQRMWLFRRTTSYLFGFSDTILKLMGFAKSGFVVTAKFADDDVAERYEQEIMEFGGRSPMFNVLATVALLNLFSLVAGLQRVVTEDLQAKVSHKLALQIVLSGLVVFINLPVYQGLFFRKDKGRMPYSVTYHSTILAILVSLLALCY